MGDELRIREAGEGDTEQILDLLRASLGEGAIPRAREYWEWKHRSNPFGTSPALVAEAEGRVVGLRVFMRWTWERDGRRIPAVRAVDTATHPDWQGRGIFTRLTLSLVERLTEDGVAFVFNTPNRFSRPGYLKMGWSSVGRMTMWVHPRRPLRALVRLAKPTAEEGDTIPAESSPSKKSGRSVAALLEEPELDDLLDSRVAGDSRLSTPRTTTYLRWRYLEIPGFDYEAAWSLNDDAAAVVVYRHRRRGSLLELRFCEVLVGPGSKSRRCAARLIRSVVRESDADYAVAMVPAGTLARRAIASSGFLPAPRLGPILTVRPLSDTTRRLDASAWSLSIGDLELF